MKFGVVDYLFIFSLVSIWALLLVNIILALNGHKYYSKINKEKIKLIEDKDCPFISILVPAHNEEKVIYKTVVALLLLNYPSSKFEVIVINDNSKDRTKDELERVRKDYKEKNLKIVTTDSKNGGKGKSNALNIGYKVAKGDYIAVYDADNVAEKNAIKYLITTLINNEALGAVIGKFRTRNKNKNILTKFINIETLSFQWMVQAGRWQLLNLATIPGTNFIIRKSVIEKLGGWDINAISEDTEISFRLYRLGYKIAFMPLAVTWEQEPETFKVWFKQRTRWAKGNIYVLFKYIKIVLKEKPTQIVFDIIYFSGVYFLFLGSVLISDALFILNCTIGLNIKVSGNFNIMWILAYILFILEVMITLAMEKGEDNLENLLLVPIMYFTYCQMWLIVAIKGLIEYFKDIIFKREIKWYKTERF